VVPWLRSSLVSSLRCEELDLRRMGVGEDPREADSAPADADEPLIAAVGAGGVRPSASQLFGKQRSATNGPLTSQSPVYVPLKRPTILVPDTLSISSSPDTK
jgi:hypothetical protein